MDKPNLEEHLRIMQYGGYQLNDARFTRLNQWNGVLFQLTGAKYYITKLKNLNGNLGEIENIYEKMSLFSAFVLNYSKCFTSGGKGQVTIDASKVFAKNSRELVTHKRLLDIRHNWIAHNGNIDLILPNVGVMEQDDRFVVRHFLTIAIPINELGVFEEALETVTNYSVAAINKHLDSIGERLGKIVLFDEA
jgi:hypothetical protein